MICGWIFRMIEGLRREREVLGNDGYREALICGFFGEETIEGRSATVNLVSFIGVLHGV